MNERYEIKELMDFVKVPAERRAACLADFAQWVDSYEAVKAVLGDALVRSHFVWIDDGIEGISAVRVMMADK